MDLARIHEVSESIQTRIGRVVFGQERAVKLMLTALFSEGHVLLEGVPGTAKTLLARTFSRLLQLEFRRIQFTPDLMPGDILGTNLFNFETNAFILKKGPIFTEILLADEINRTPPKTQAALLEAMQERSVTLDGTPHDLGPGFMVVATQNPIEQEGTYPLPEAQLDRFLFKITIGYPSRQEECELVETHGNSNAMPKLDAFELDAVLNMESLVEVRQAISGLRLAPEMVGYIVDIVRATREHPDLICGASPRAANMIAQASRAWAALAGREYVIPDDVKEIAVGSLAHRVVLSPAAEIEGTGASDVLISILDQVEAPR